MKSCHVRVDLAPGYVVIVSGGSSDDSELPVVLGASMVIAADSGAHFLYRNGIVPAVLLGDFDSCDAGVVAHMRDKAARIVTLRRDKDKTDTEVALDLACEQGFKEAALLGGMGGGRPEHSIANLFLLETYAKRGLDVVMFYRDTFLFGLGDPARAPRQERRFGGQPGDWLSLFPVTKTVDGVTTSGLRFPLSNATLKRGATLGTSNEMTGDEAGVKVEKGFLLVAGTTAAARNEACP